MPFSGWNIFTYRLYRQVRSIFHHTTHLAYMQTQVQLPSIIQKTIFSCLNKQAVVLSAYLLTDGNTWKYFLLCFPGPWDSGKLWLENAWKLWRGMKALYCPFRFGVDYCRSVFQWSRETVKTCASIHNLHFLHPRHVVRSSSVGQRKARSCFGILSKRHLSQLFKPTMVHVTVSLSGEVIFSQGEGKDYCIVREVVPTSFC